MTSHPNDITERRRRLGIVLEARRFSPVLVARMFDVEPHVVVGPDELPAGYWRDAERRRIERRSLAARVRRFRRRFRR